MTAIRFDATIPVLRIFELAKARAFYEGFLGLARDWEHRFAPDLPVFAQVSRGALVLFLSEHFGDGTPGTNLILRMAGLDLLHAEPSAKRDRHARPGVAAQPWGWRDLAVTDPFGKQLVFSEPLEAPG